MHFGTYQISPLLKACGAKKAVMAHTVLWCYANSTSVCYTRAGAPNGSDGYSKSRAECKAWLNADSRSSTVRPNQIRRIAVTGSDGSARLNAPKQQEVNESAGHFGCSAGIRLYSV